MTASVREHIVFNKDGSVCAKGPMRGKIQHGYWEWYRKDGTKLRSGHFENGEQVGSWTTYNKNGEVYKVTQIKKKIAEKVAESEATDSKRAE